MKHTRWSLLRLVCLPLAALAAAGRADGADLCQVLVQDKVPHPMTALAKPALGQAVVDPQFGATLRRITAVPPSTSDAAIVPLYSTISAWNADESLLLLYHVGSGHELYDGRTYRFLRSINIQPTDIEQVWWHTSDPDVLLYPSGNRLVRYHVSSGVNETVRTFGFCAEAVTAGDDPMFTSWDSNTVGLRCGTTMFLYQISTDTVTGMGTTTSVNAPQAAPSGALAVLDGAVLDRSLVLQRQLDLANSFEHASIGRLANGRDTYNTVVFDPGPLGSDVGSLVSFDLLNGSSQVVVGPATGWPYPPSGTHVSSLAYRNPGWVFLSIVGNPSGQGVLDNEIVVTDTNTGRVCRAAHHRSYGRNNTHLAQPYWAEPHVVPSPTGTRAIFGSDWGNGATVDTYVVELPSDLGLTTPQYRLYSPITLEHLYTTDYNEYVTLGTRGWGQEGIAYQLFRDTTPYLGVTPTPLYRLYHPGILQHLWTTDANEKNVLAAGGSWTYEGVAGYVLPTAVTGSTPLLRMSLPNPPLHLWTTDQNEYTVLQTRGWMPEGAIGHVLP